MQQLLNDTCSGSLPSIANGHKASYVHTHMPCCLGITQEQPALSALLSSVLCCLGPELASMARGGHGCYCLVINYDDSLIAMDFPIEQHDPQSF